MKRKFLVNLFILVSLNLLVKPFWIFGIDRSVQNQVGTENYGLYFSLLGFSLMINTLLDIGITNFNNRNIARHHNLLPKYLSNIFMIKLLLGFLYAIVSISIALLLGYSTKQFHLLYVLIFNQFLLSFILYFRSGISGLQFFKTDSLLSVLDRLLMIALCSMLLWSRWFPPIQIEWFVYAQTLAYGITFIVAFSIVVSKSAYFKPVFKKKYLFAILKQSYPFAVLALLMGFYNRIDSVMLERLLPDGKIEAGIYAQGFRVLDAFSNFALLFAGLLLPMFSRMIAQKTNTAELTHLSFRILIVPALSFAIYALFFGSQIMEMLYHNTTDQSSNVFKLLMWGFVFISITYIYGTLLTANGNLKSLNKLAIIAVILNLSLNYILIPHYKSTGSAIASLITQSFMALTQMYMGYRMMSHHLYRKNVFSWIIYAGALVLCGCILQRTDYSWAIETALFAGTMTVMVIVSRMLPINALKALFISLTLR